MSELKDLQSNPNFEPQPILPKTYVWQNLVNLEGVPLLSNKIPILQETIFGVRDRLHFIGDGGMGKTTIAGELKDIIQTVAIARGMAINVTELSYGHCLAEAAKQFGGLNIGMLKPLDASITRKTAGIIFMGYIQKWAKEKGAKNDPTSNEKEVLVTTSPFGPNIDKYIDLAHGVIEYLGESAARNPDRELIGYVAGHPKILADSYILRNEIPKLPLHEIVPNLKKRYILRGIDESQPIWLQGLQVREALKRTATPERLVQLRQASLRAADDWVEAHSSWGDVYARMDIAFGAHGKEGMDEVEWKRIIKRALVHEEWMVKECGMEKKGGIIKGGVIIFNDYQSHQVPLFL